MTLTPNDRSGAEHRPTATLVDHDATSQDRGPQPPTRGVGAQQMRISIDVFGADGAQEVHFSIDQQDEV
jgi:hypothetical protein